MTILSLHELVVTLLLLNFLPLAGALALSGGDTEVFPQVFTIIHIMQVIVASLIAFFIVLLTGSIN
jgi:hypothetical protein